jgi:hypothetical protein
MGPPVIAWKFLAPGAIGPFSRFNWPTPTEAGAGPWVQAVVHPCSTGIHACALDDLPWWLHGELWEVELSGQIAHARHKLVAERGRLVRRVSEWDRDAMHDFCEDCARRVRDYATRSPAAAEYLQDLDQDIAGCLAPTASDDAARAAVAADGHGAREVEKAAQARWLATRLGLGLGSSAG